MVHAIVLAGFSNIFEYILKFNINTSLGFLSIVLNISMFAITIFISKYTYINIEKRFRDVVKLRVNKNNQNNQNN